VTRCLDARPSPLDDPHRSSRLRLELAEGRLHEPNCDASPGQVVPDQGVAGSPLGQDRGAAARKALVVHGSRSNQAFHGLNACGWADLRPREPLGQLFLGQAAPRKRASGLRHRLVPDELAAHSPRPATVELDADI
jgi:hypothetical protein